jgi:hypothetical protein
MGKQVLARILGLIAISKEELEQVEQAEEV